jgi:hypothetical protein
MHVPGLGEMPLCSMAGNSGATSMPHQTTGKEPFKTTMGIPLSTSVEALSLMAGTTDGQGAVMEEEKVGSKSTDKPRGAADPSNMNEG